MYSKKSRREKEDLASLVPQCSWSHGAGGRSFVIQRIWGTQHRNSETQREQMKELFAVTRYKKANSSLLSRNFGAWMPSGSDSSLSVLLGMQGQILQPFLNQEGVFPCSLTWVVYFQESHRFTNWLGCAGEADIRPALLKSSADKRLTAHLTVSPPTDSCFSSLTVQFCVNAV